MYVFVHQGQGGRDEFVYFSLWTCHFLPNFNITGLKDFLHGYVVSALKKKSGTQHFRWKSLNTCVISNLCMKNMMNISNNKTEFTYCRILLYSQKTVKMDNTKAGLNKIKQHKHCTSLVSLLFTQQSTHAYSTKIPKMPQGKKE